MEQRREIDLAEVTQVATHNRALLLASTRRHCSRLGVSKDHVEDLIHDAVLVIARRPPEFGAGVKRNVEILRALRAQARWGVIRIAQDSARERSLDALAVKLGERLATVDAIEESERIALEREVAALDERFMTAIAREITKYQWECMVLCKPRNGRGTQRRSLPPLPTKVSMGASRGRSAVIKVARRFLPASRLPAVGSPRPAAAALDRFLEELGFFDPSFRQRIRDARSA